MLSWDLQEKLAVSLVLRCLLAKRRRRNRVRERNPVKIEEESSALEKFAEQFVVSSAHAGKRSRLSCSYGHKGSTTQR